MWKKVLEWVLSIAILVGGYFAITTVLTACFNESDNQQTEEEYENEDAEDEEELSEEEEEEKQLEKEGIIRPEKAIEHVGEELGVQGRVCGVSYRDDLDGQPLFINIGADYPDESRCQVVVWGDNYEMQQMIRDSVKVDDIWRAYGVIEEYDGVAQIEIKEEGQLEPINN